MNPIKLLFLSFGILCLVMIAAPSRAAVTAEKDTCGGTTAISATGATFTASIGITAPGSSNCQNHANSVTDATYIGVELPAKSPINFLCTQFTAGTGPPAQPTITVSGYSDNSNIGGGGTPIWTTSFASCATSPATTSFTEWLTSDGTSTGSAKAGIVRLFVSIDTTGAGAYHCNSDDSGETPPVGGACNNNAALTIAVQSVMRSDPGFTAPNLTASGTCSNGCTTYIGSDTVTTSITSNATAYVAANRLGSSLKSDSGPLNAIGVRGSLVSGSNTRSAQIVGSTSTWPDGGLTLDWTEAGGASLTGYTGMSYWAFTMATIPNTMTLVTEDEVTWASGDSLNRQLTCAAPSVNVDGTSSTLANRGSFVSADCASWKDSRGNLIANLNAESTYERSGNYRSYLDFGSINGTTSAGTFATNIQAKFSSCANPASNGPGCATTTTGSNYHKQLWTCSAACVNDDSNLFNLGNSSGIFDVTDRFTFTLNDSTRNPPTTGNNNSCAPCSYTISVDSEFGRVRSTTEGSGLFVSSVNDTCQRFTGPSLNTLVDSQAPTGTDTNGDSGTVLMQVIPPAGQYSWNCTLSFQGNTGFYNVTFFFVSPFTGNLAIPVWWNVTPLTNGTDIVNVSLRFTMFDQASGQQLCVSPDANPRLTLRFYNSSTDTMSDVLVDRAIMIPGGIGVDAFTGCRWVNQTYLPHLNVSRGGVAYAFFNHSSSPLVGSEGFTFDTLPSIGNIGNFTGNFTGNVTDLSAIPASIAVPMSIAAFAAGLAIVAFAATRRATNPYPVFACFLASLVGWWLTFTSVTPSTGWVDNGTFLVLMSLWVFVVAMLAFRTFMIYRNAQPDLEEQ